MADRSTAAVCRHQGCEEPGRKVRLNIKTQETHPFPTRLCKKHLVAYSYTPEVQTEEMVDGE